MCAGKAALHNLQGLIGHGVRVCAVPFLFLGSRALRQKPSRFPAQFFKPLREHRFDPPREFPGPVTLEVRCSEHYGGQAVLEIHLLLALPGLGVLCVREPAAVLDEHAHGRELEVWIPQARLSPVDYRERMLVEEGDLVAVEEAGDLLLALALIGLGGRCLLEILGLLSS